MHKYILLVSILIKVLFYFDISTHAVRLTNAKIIEEHAFCAVFKSRGLNYAFFSSSCATAGEFQEGICPMLPILSIRVSKECTAVWLLKISPACSALLDHQIKLRTSDTYSLEALIGLLSILSAFLPKALQFNFFFCLSVASPCGGWFLAVF